MTTTYTVTTLNVNGANKYVIDGVVQPHLTLIEGNTYEFDWSAVSGHPLRFGTAPDGPGYNDGVTVNGTTSTIIVPVGSPTLYYYCYHHSGMGGQLTTEAAGNASGDPFVTPMFTL